MNRIDNYSLKYPLRQKEQADSTLFALELWKPNNAFKTETIVAMFLVEFTFPDFTSVYRIIRYIPICLFQAQAYFNYYRDGKVPIDK